MSIYLIIGTIVWLYALTILKRAKLPAFYFIVGSGGLFFILIALSDPYWVWFFTHAVVNGVRWFGAVTGWSTTMPKYSIVSIINQTAPINMSIDYECSGIIETAAYLSLVVFFPLYNRFEKLFFSVAGMLWIYMANVIRLSVIITIVHFAGANYFFVAHAMIGRLVFYALVIVLYYEIFTYSQVSQNLYHVIRRRFHRKGAEWWIWVIG